MDAPDLADLLHRAADLSDRALTPEAELAEWKRDELAARAAGRLLWRPLELAAEVAGYQLAGAEVLEGIHEAADEWGRAAEGCADTLASGQVLMRYWWSALAEGRAETLAFLRAPIMAHPLPGYPAASPDRWRQLDEHEVELLVRGGHAPLAGPEARAYAPGRAGSPVAPSDPDLARAWERLGETLDATAPDAPPPPAQPAPAPALNGPRFVRAGDYAHPGKGRCDACGQTKRHRHELWRCTRCGLTGEQAVMTELAHTCPAYAGPKGASA